MNQAIYEHFMLSSEGEKKNHVRLFSKWALVLTLGSTIKQVKLKHNNVLIGIRLNFILIYIYIYICIIRYMYVCVYI